MEFKIEGLHDLNSRNVKNVKVRVKRVCQVILLLVLFRCSCTYFLHQTCCQGLLVVGEKLIPLSSLNCLLCSLIYID